jgi:hypothetical protein
MAVRLSALSAVRALFSRNIFVSGIHFSSKLYAPGPSELEGLGKMKKKNIHFTGFRSTDLPASSIVPNT